MKCVHIVANVFNRRFQAGDECQSSNSMLRKLKQVTELNIFFFRITQMKVEGIELVLERSKFTEQIIVSS